MANYKATRAGHQHCPIGRFHCRPRVEAAQLGWIMNAIDAGVLNPPKYSKARVSGEGGERASTQGPAPPLPPVLAQEQRGQPR
jgi:hypothetical protein